MEMGQEEPKAQVKIFPTEHSIPMHCSILSKSTPPSRAASFPVLPLPFVSVRNSTLQLHNLKSFAADNWKYIHPHLCCPASGLLSMEKKTPTIRYSSSPKDKATLLFKQSFFLPFHTHNPLSRTTAASMCTWEVLPPVSFPTSSFSLLFCSPKHRFCINIPSLCSCTLLYISSPF